MEAQDDRRTQLLDLARRWRASGTKARAFAQEHRVTPWVLYYWRQRLARNDRPVHRRPRARPVKLAPVHVVTNTDGGLEIMSVSGDRLRVSRGVRPDLVARVVRVLRRPC